MSSFCILLKELLLQTTAFNVLKNNILFIDKKQSYNMTKKLFCINNCNNIPIYIDNKNNTLKIIIFVAQMNI